MERQTNDGATEESKVENQKLTKDRIASCDNEWLLLHLIWNYKDNFFDKEKSEWSDEVVDLWEEALARMKEPVVHGFDKEGYLNKLEEEYEQQDGLLKSPDYTYSYHYGIRSGLDIALREFRKAIRAEK